MTGFKKRPVIFFLAGFLLTILAVTLQGVQGDLLEPVPSEAQCRPYIEKALKDLDPEKQEHNESLENKEADGSTEGESSNSSEENAEAANRSKREANEGDSNETVEEHVNEAIETDQIETIEIVSAEEAEETGSEAKAESSEENTKGSLESGEKPDDENAATSVSEETQSHEDNSKASTESVEKSEEVNQIDADTSDSKETNVEQQSEENATIEASDASVETPIAETSNEDSKENETENEKESVENSKESNEANKSDEIIVENETSLESEITQESKESNESGNENSAEDESKTSSNESENAEPTPEEDLIMEIEIPEILRPRDHINEILKLNEVNEQLEKSIEKIGDVTLRDLKRMYDNAIKPLETLYKYRDLSNRHFGDSEIFSKPLVLFMGPWSGGKSSIINYLLDMEYKTTSLVTGAEPSPAYFNILMHGEEEEILDGTQLAADWTFSGLQKFGQGLLDRLKGYKLNNKLLEKVNIVEIPGILEIRKQVQRLFPFNDACQWFIDRADIIFLVYDPSKLDVGPETEAILDQLKGREHQTRIILNKADQVKPEELMRVQGALIWNISPLMSSAEPPMMYSTSLWSIPYEIGAPTRLLYAQERAFLKDLRSAIDKKVEHKIASARRFAVRVRNHAKMVDCYLTTYYNQKSFFAKRKEVSDKIIENPQEYHIYEGLSTLTNISRYDLPDPDVYRDFFHLNSLYDFPLLSSTCTYFKGCPINRLDVAISYELPEIVGKYKKSIEALIQEEAAAAAAAAAVEQAAEEATLKPDTQKVIKSGASRISMS